MNRGAMEKHQYERERARIAEIIRPGRDEYLSRWRPPATMMRISAKPAMAKRSRTTTMTRKRRRFGRRRFKKNYPSRTLQPYSIARWMTTATYLALNPAAGAITVSTLVLNSGFDPLGSASATQQPLGFEQYEALYNRYCVIGWKIGLECCSTDNSNPVVVGFTPLPTITTLTSFQHYKELPSTVQRIITPDIDKVVFGMRGSVKRWLLPRGGKMLSDTDLSAVTTAYPTKILYGHLYAHAMDVTADPALVHCVIKLRQLVVFFDPKVPARSTQ